jgi:hypothetical protein
MLAHPGKRGARAGDDRQIELTLDTPPGSMGQGRPEAQEDIQALTPQLVSAVNPSVDPARDQFAPSAETRQAPKPSARVSTAQSEMSQMLEGSIETQPIGFLPATSPEENKTCRPPSVLPYDTQDTGDVAGTQFDVPIPQLLDIYELLRPFIEDPNGPRSTQRAQSPRRTRGSGASN